MCACSGFQMLGAVELVSSRDVLGQCSHQAAVHRPLNQVSDDSGKPKIKEKKNQQNKQLSEHQNRKAERALGGCMGWECRQSFRSLSCWLISSPQPIVPDPYP